MIGLRRKTIFVDRNSGGHIFKDLITRANIRVVLHDEYFDQDTPDHIWLREVGKRGWVSVTCDKAVERNLYFLMALKRSNAHVFILCGMIGATREQKADCIITAYDDIVQRCIYHDGPQLWKFEKSGPKRQIDLRHVLGLITKHHPR